MVKRKSSKSPRRKRAKKGMKPRVRRVARAPSARGVEVALAGIAHDIRTPLTGIVALAELLASSDLGPREREWANALKSGAEHLAGLSTLIVDAVRADVAGLTLRDERFSPRALAEAVGQGLIARAGAKEIGGEVTVSPDLPAFVMGDALRLRAALENLADNAVKFTPAGTVRFGAATVAAARGKVRLVFTVGDSGIGLSAADLKQLFRPFAQASEQIARRYGGAGLGLVFVKRLAKAMGGDLKVASKPGGGSVFTLTVLAARADEDEKISEDGTGAGPARSFSILCAEDNPYGRVVMSTILRELGHRVDFATTGDAAVQVAARGGYDAIVMDVMLPGIDGLEATRRIRALPGAAGNVPVIGISGRADAADEAAARAAGMDYYFAKPVSPAKLAEALKAL
jgi:CheY-like chemotaxis protein/nitrogen-specific signal transduction histidine kinase